MSTFSRYGIFTIHPRSVRVDIGKRTYLTFILQVLSGEEFFKGMIGLVEPLSDEGIRNQRWVIFQKENRRNLVDLLVGAI